MRTQFSVAALLVLAVSGCADSQPKPPSIVELQAMLQSNDPQAQVEATQWIVQLGPKAAELAPALIAALKSPHVEVRQKSATAMGYVGADPTIISALTLALEDKEFGVRMAAANALGQLGPAASSAIPALERFSNSESAERQGSSCNPGAEALKKIRP